MSVCSPLTVVVMPPEAEGDTLYRFSLLLLLLLLLLLHHCLWPAVFGDIGTCLTVCPESLCESGMIGSQTRALKGTVRCRLTYVFSSFVTTRDTILTPLQNFTFE